MSPDPTTVIATLLAAVTTLSGLLLKGWQDRVKRSEEAERAATKALLDSKDAELERTRAVSDGHQERSQYLEDQRAQLTRRLLDIQASQAPPPEKPPRSQSPNPTAYSMLMKTKPTRRSGD